MLRSVGRAATATQSQVNDIAESMFQAGESLKIPMSDAARSLDMMAAAGAAGSFELKNMAKDLPNLSAKYASLGGAGADALGSITAGAQIAMKTTSDAAVAANNFKNFLDKLAAPETIKNFDKMGVNLTEQVKKGIESGDLVGYMGKVIGDMTKGDATKLGALFTDVQARDFALALTQHVDEYKKIRGEVMSAVGTIDQQAAVMAQTTQEKIKGIGISMNVALDEATMFKSVLSGIKSVAEWFAANPDVFGPLATIVTALAVGGAGIVVAGTALAAVGSALGIIAAAGPALVLAAPAIATIVGAIAAWKVGFAVGTWLNEQIDLMVQAVTGDKAASLGGALYDMIEGPNGIITWFGSIPEKLGALWENAKAAAAGLIEAMKEGFSLALKGELGIGAKLTSAIAYIKTTAKDWLQVGKDIIQGLIDGVQAKAQAVIDKIRGLGGAAVREMKDLLGIKSPSKVFMVIGEQIGEGMAIGMTMQVENVHKAAKKLGIAAAYGAKDKETALWIKGQLTDYESMVAELDKDADKATAARAKAQEDMRRDAERLTNTLRTETEKQMDEFDRYQTMLEAGAISWDTYARAVAAGHENMGKTEPGKASKFDRDQAVAARFAQGASTSDLSREFGLSLGYIEKIVSKTSEADTVFGKLRTTMESAFKGMEDALVNFVKTGKLDFKSLADSMISDLIRIQVQEMMTNSLKPMMNSAMSAIGSFFGFAQGGTPGGTSAWRNQIVDKPTFFAFAKGGVMGEAGPEAIMPLARGPDGNLGVRASGGSNVTVNVINNAQGTQATARESTDGNGNRMIEVFIEQVKGAIAGDISRGSGAVPDAMASTYGLNRVAGAY
jgi:hypothetical protein